MKQLTRSSAFCLPVFLVLFLFAFSFLMPSPAMAKVDYTNGTGIAEGDPGDGLGFASGGGGLLSGSGNNSILDYITGRMVFVDVVLPGYLVPRVVIITGVGNNNKNIVILKSKRIHREVHR